MTSMLRFRDAEEWREWAERRKARWSTRPENSQAAISQTPLTPEQEKALRAAKITYTQNDNVEFVDIGMGTLRIARPPGPLTGPRQFTLRLPWPPSLNTNTMPRADGGRYLTDEHRNFRALVATIIFAAGIKRLDGRLSVLITAFPPDARQRDLDNIVKPVLDALQRGGAILNDAHVDQLTILRAANMSPRIKGQVSVTVRELA